MFLRPQNGLKAEACIPFRGSLIIQWL
uniref:Uncharacterized protein n=1 Tax=Anguilla anguilla TaxID=7936 RepID=A0A0E9VLP6_ANGAN